MGLELVHNEPSKPRIGILKDTRGAKYAIIQKLPDGCIVENARGNKQLILKSDIKSIS